MTIFWFSGSGNSLLAARFLASAVQGANPVSIADVMRSAGGDSHLDTEGEGPVVLVFPVYHASFGMSGIPGIVERFIERSGAWKGRRVYGVATHDGFPGPTLHRLTGKLRQHGVDLAGGFALKAGVPYTAKEKLAHVLFGRLLLSNAEADKEQRRIVQSSMKKRISEIAAIISSEIKAPIEGMSLRNAKILKPWFAFQKKMAEAHYRQLAGETAPSFMELTRKADRAFTVSEACTSCGTCQIVCPTANVSMEEGIPRWNNHCENCFACYQSCPVGAICGSITTYQKKYRPPGIRTKDFILA